MTPKSEGDRPPLPGRATYLRLRWDGPARPPAGVGKGTEVLLIRDAGGTPILEVAGTTSAVSGLDLRAERSLHDLLDRPGARVALTASTEKERGSAIDLEVYEYAAASELPYGQILSFGVPDKVLAGVRRAAQHAVRHNDAPGAIAWLADRLFLPAAPGDPAGRRRAVVSMSEHQDARAPDAFRIHGRGVAVDVRVKEDVLMLDRVLSRGHDRSHGPLMLLDAAVELVDESTASRLREDTRRELRRLAAGQGFLALWNRYNRIESWWVLRGVVDAGYVRYTGWRRLEDGTYQFALAADQRPELRQQFLDSVRAALNDAAEDARWDVDATQRVPPVVERAVALGSGSSDDVGDDLLTDRPAADTVSGTVVVVDEGGAFVDLRPVRFDAPGTIMRSRSWSPPLAGFLHRSFRGDQRRLRRRHEAMTSIFSGRTRISSLLGLIEGQVDAPVLPPSRRIAARSLAADALFGARGPTPLQERAIDIALNTPDVAVIQGPPGTGKTQVIAAIQTRLAEEGRRFADLRGAVLLSSYQHAAVDEVVQRSAALGLPANKLDRAGRGSTVQLDRWQERALGSVEARIRSWPGSEAPAVLGHVAAVVAGHRLRPGGPAETIALIEEVQRLAGGLLPGQLSDRLSRARYLLTLPEEARRSAVPAQDGTASGSVVGSAELDRRELARRAVVALPTGADPAGADPVAAARAARRLRTLPPPPPADLLAALDDAAAATEDRPGPAPDELGLVRQELLEWLDRPSVDSAAAAAGRDPYRPDQVTDLLSEVVAAVETRVADSPADGTLAALLAYRDGLAGDPEAVRWTLRDYTMSYAATCQQASSPAVRDAKQVERVEDISFDTVIVDEAARANPLDLMIPLNQAERRIVLVGDHHQLPQMLEPDIEREFDVDIRDRLSESMFQRLYDSIERTGDPVGRVVRLTTQFRMHPRLGELVSRHFYGGTLLSGRGEDEFRHGLPGYGSAVAAWIDVPRSRGRERGQRSKSRPGEADVVARTVRDLLAAAPGLTFGIVTFYAAQRDAIWQALVDEDLAERPEPRQPYQVIPGLRHQDPDSGRRRDRLMVGTVDAFQGKEFDVVLLSTTRCIPAHEAVPGPENPERRSWVARRYGHVVLRNRLCVAMSRQRRLLIAVGDARTFERGVAPIALEPLSDFLTLCREGPPYGATR